MKQPNGNILRKTLRLSILEGIFAQIYGTFTMIGSAFIVKLLIILQASPIQFSLLTSIGQVSQVFQPLGVAITHYLKRRRKACVAITALGRFLTLFLGMGLFFADPRTGIWYTLLLLFCSSALLSIGGNIWIAWISDSVHISYRGRFFSRRNQFLLIAGLVAGYLGSFAVDLFDPHRKGLSNWFIHFTGLGNYIRPEFQGRFLTSLFILGTLIGLAGLAILARQPERKTLRRESSLLATYKKPLKDPNFRRLLFFGMWWMLATGIGSAFWGPFMMEKLRMSLFEVQLYGSFNMISSLLSYRFWGRFIDANGNKAAMSICIVLGGLNPMLWLFMTPVAHNIIWLEAISSGFMWAGAGLVATNFVLSVAPKGETQAYSGFYGAFGGLCMMCSTMLSGVFFPSPMHLFKLNLQPEQVLFGLGGLLRWTALIPLAFVLEARTKSLRDISLLVWENITSRLRQTKE